MANEPVVVRRTMTVEEAHIIVAWLADQGVEATVADRNSTGVMAFGVTDTEGIEIVVPDEEAAKKAQALLEAHDAKHKIESGKGTPLEIKCDECGTLNRFPSTVPGMVLECDECGAYLDVPGSEGSGAKNNE